LLCDEPTGALDLETGKVVLSVLNSVYETLGTTVVIITHNATIGGMADRVIRIADGRVRGVLSNARRIAVDELEW
ncbi:MAG: ABC transporter ATP-binding protein, partial [Candidatus Hydrogenedentes bacterium]|nr:ABC transporter ATP-binding protein [Candidatus Hydrogenedentota bacterium]